jgi:hypothetical protein
MLRDRFIIFRSQSLNWTGPEGVIRIYLVYKFSWFNISSSFFISFNRQRKREICNSECFVGTVSY